MLTFFALHLVVTAATAVPAVAPHGIPMGIPMGIPRLDTLVMAKRGTRLELDAGQVAGQIQVHTWDRDEVSIAGPPNARVRVQGGVVRVSEAVDGSNQNRSNQNRPNNPRASATNRNIMSGNGRSGARPRPDSVNWQLMVPQWMALDISAGLAQVSVEGAGNSVDVEAEGSVSILGGSGTVSATSYGGSVSVERTRGSITAKAINGMVRVTGTTGDVVRAESINGTVRLERVDARSVTAANNNGDIEFEGTIRDHGLYRLDSHNGRVRVVLPDNANVTVAASSYRGAFQAASFPIAKASTSSGRGQPQTFAMGTGSASLIVSSFNGNVEFLRSH